MHKINVLVAGSTGYIGIELVKILINHKYVNIKFLCGSTSVGKSLSNYDKSLKKKHLPKIIKFNKKLLSKVDVIFTALPNGQCQILANKLKMIFLVNGKLLKNQISLWRIQVKLIKMLPQLMQHRTLTQIKAFGFYKFEKFLI